jgi:CRP/FNR family cyclic AMP-dependent transcriptional regulator
MPLDANGGDSPQTLYKLIERQPFFKGLNPPQLQLLADSAMKSEFETGQWILRDAEPANRFYLILEGRVVLESEVKDRGSVPIRTLGPGDDLGWSWLFPPYYTHFGARAIEPVKAIFFYGTRLREKCEEDHELGYEIMKRIAGVAVQNLHATQQRLMECADPTKLSNQPC